MVKGFYAGNMIAMVMSEYNRRDRLGIVAGATEAVNQFAAAKTAIDQQQRALRFDAVSVAF